jgi:D-alanyl-D-alanine carboxypeptidase (penicillin-binding protein 5/6)
VKLGEYALANPVLAGIVNQQQAVIPVAGIVHNVNWLLGVDGTDGIKTGNTDQAGGCFLFAAKQDIGDQQVQVVGAVLGAPDDTDPTQAIEDSQAIIEGSDVYFRLVQVSNANDKVGEYTTAWGASSTVVAKNALSLPVWNGSQAKINNNLIKISGATDAGAKVGTISITSSQRTAAVPVVLQQKIPGPSVFWRIFHI